MEPAWTATPKGVRALTHSDDTTRAPRAIETRYNGFRFRSRLEARWAVFFDALGIRYEYEREGYELPGGVRYLPDFWLPQQECFIEIKGWQIAEGDETYLKAQLLAEELEAFVYVFCGQIRDAGNTLGLEFHPWMRIEGHEQPEPEHVWWFRCPVCLVWQLGSVIWQLRCDCLNHHPSRNPDLITALDRARQARFEFGESGG